MSSTAIVSMDSEQFSPIPKASPDHRSVASSDSEYINTFLLREPPNVWQPYLEKFTLFPKLPIEIRQAIWKTTLEPRAVELEHSTERGFYSRVHVPVALRVNKDSRNAVGFLYPLCFGNILHQPRIVFNFSMDTLYFDEFMWTEVPMFLIGLKDVELNRIQSIAVDRSIDEIREWDDNGYNPYGNMDCFETAIAAMPALREFLVVVKIDEMWYEHGWPQGSGTIKLYEEFPWELHEHYVSLECYIDEDACECLERPTFEHMVRGLNVLKTDSVWGWRPTKTT